MLHIAKTKQTRRTQRKREGSRRATRRSTPPFSPLLAMVGGETDAEKATNEVREAYEKWLGIENINQVKINALDKLLNAINNENFDGNFVFPETGSTLLGGLLYHYYDIGEEDDDNDVSSTSGIAGRTRSKTKGNPSEQLNSPQEGDDLTEEHDKLLGQCIDNLLKKEKIIVDTTTKEGQSIMSAVMTIDVVTKNNFFKAVFDKSNAKVIINDVINKIDDIEKKDALLLQLKDNKLIYKNVVQLCVQDLIKHNFYNVKSRTLTKEGKKLESALYSVGIFSKLNSTTKNNYVDDLIKFNTAIATSTYSSRILICNALLQLLISKIKKESTELSDEQLDICPQSTQSNNDKSPNPFILEKDLINTFFKNINAINAINADDSTKKKEKKAITNEYGALILTTLIRTYESQIESKEKKNEKGKKKRKEENDEEEEEENDEDEGGEASSRGSSVS